MRSIGRGHVRSREVTIHVRSPIALVKVKIQKCAPSGGASRHRSSEIQAPSELISPTFLPILAFKNNKSPPSHLTRVLDLENLSSGSRWGRRLVCLGLNTSIFHTLFKKVHIKQKRINILCEKSAICLSLSD